jgi:hypothetical protein
VPERLADQRCLTFGGDGAIVEPGSAPVLLQLAAADGEPAGERGLLLQRA